jgi:hypothetical protein
MGGSENNQISRRTMVMRPRFQKFAALILAVILNSSAFAGKAMTFTGTVSDAMCGAKHMMEGDPAGCLRACVQKGSKYALVVGDKVFTLDTSDKTTLDALDKLANQKVRVKGSLDGDTISVSSVAAVP